MAAAQKDAVNRPLHAHLALDLLLQDGALLHSPPFRDSIVGAYRPVPHEMRKDTFDLLGVQLHYLLLSDSGNAEQLQDLLPTDWTLRQLLSTLVAGDQVAAVKDDTVNVRVH